MDLGPQSESGNKFTKKCRLLQSKYRCNSLKVNYGVGPNFNSKDLQGNMLSNGENTGLNFLSETAFNFAKQKVLDKQINKNLTIDEFRLFNNMLSSMPMCFNLFSDLRQHLLDDRDETSGIIKRMFSEIDWIETTEYIDVEFIPNPIEYYTNDKTAFDAMILVKDEKGKKGLITIETKYTDLLGSNSSSNIELKNKIVEENNLFSEQYSIELRQNGYKQIHRNYILTYAYAKRNKIRNFINVIISPKEDLISEKEINEVKQALTKNKDSIIKIPLESFVERGIGCENKKISKIMKEFQKRYLNFE